MVYSVSPAGEKFALPGKDESDKEYRRVEKLSTLAGQKEKKLSW